MPKKPEARQPESSSSGEINDLRGGGGGGGTFVLPLGGLLKKPEAKQPERSPLLSLVNCCLTVVLESLLGCLPRKPEAKQPERSSSPSSFFVL